MMMRRMIIMISSRSVGDGRGVVGVAGVDVVGFSVGKVRAVVVVGVLGTMIVGFGVIVVVVVEVVPVGPVLVVALAVVVVVGVVIEVVEVVVVVVGGGLGRQAYCVIITNS